MAPLIDEGEPRPVPGPEVETKVKAPPPPFVLGTWMPIENEAFREYIFPTGTVRIMSPKKVLVKRKPEGDSHRIVAVIADGTPISYYIPAGWLAIRWVGVDGAEVFDW